MRVCISYAFTSFIMHTCEPYIKKNVTSFQYFSSAVFKESVKVLSQPCCVSGGGVIMQKLQHFLISLSLLKIFT